MKILVTGASGFLAARFCRYYESAHEVVGSTRQTMDFTNADAVRAYFAQVRPDIVLHCGAISDVGACERDVSASWKVNVEGTENIAKACQLHRAKLILCSSDQVYFGSANPLPHREDEALEPPHAYGKQKLEAERRAMRYNADTVCLRLSWLYDKEKQREDEHGNFLTNLLDDIARQRGLCYPVYDKRSITNVWEVVRNMEKAFVFAPGIYNFGSENDDSTYEVVARILRFMRVSPECLEENRVAFQERPRNLRMNVEKAKAHGADFFRTVQGLEACMEELHLRG